MSYESFPNDAHNNRVVTLAEHEQIAAPLGLSGLLNYSATAPVFADSSGRQVKLRAGVAASLRGTRFNNTSETIITIPANTSGQTRVDLVVLRLRRQESSVGADDQYTVAPAVVQGTPAATNAAAPGPLRDDTPGVGFWEMPLAEVTVPHNAASIAVSQVVPRAYYISGSGYAGREDWALPPVEPGVFFRAHDTGVTYIGTAGGVWQQLYHDTGWVAVPGGQSAAGWDFRGFHVARHGNLVVLIMDLLRTGAPVGASTHQYFGPIEDQFRPALPINPPTHVGSPDHSTHTTINPDGVVILVGNGAQGINTGGQVVADATWVVNPRTATATVTPR